MGNEKPLLEQPADLATLRALYRDGILSKEAYEEAHKLLRPVSLWLDWARHRLLLLGSTLVLAGIIYFFAYNWWEMGRFTKFGILQGGILLCVMGAHFRGGELLTGKVFLLSSSVLVGVLLAVFGQIYQTGADPYQLFLSWAALIACWVWIGKFAGLWMLWLSLLNTAAWFYWIQVGEPNGVLRFDLFCIFLLILNLMALALSEWGVKKKLPWLKGKWIRPLLLILTLAVISIPTVLVLADAHRSMKISPFIVLFWLGVIIGELSYFRYKIKDMLALAIVSMDFCLLLLIWIARLLFENGRGSMASSLFIYAVTVLGTVIIAAKLLRSTAQTMKQELGEPVQ